MQKDRRKFLKNTAMSAISWPMLTLSRLMLAGDPKVAYSKPQTIEYQSWQDVYKQAWTWDSVVSSTHFCNCSHNCSWKLYVKEGIVWREEQNASYRHLNKGLADDNPQGCQKGAAFSHEMYSQNRLQHPLKRIGPRGSRRWQRISWDEALHNIAKTIIEVVRDEGSDRVCIPLGTQGQEAKSRFANALGAVLLDPAGEVGDALIGAMMTTGTQMHAGSSDSRLLADCIISWVYNQNDTRIADVHHLHEARYNGATIISVSPDQSPTHMHADYWVNPRPGT